ncbi:MAG: lipopolysaccharide biosynthesis protein, partial [Elusimicrobiales bacterium]|nr:lipopolysaccharide biosynthesis protein [Elusimicrobiales bacterium]
MFTRIRRLGRESVVYGLSTVLARLLNFFLVPYYTHALSPGQYGVVAAVYSYIAFLNIVFQYGMDQSYMRFVCADRPREKTIFSTAFWPVLLTSAMLAALLWQLRAPLAAIGGIGADYSALITYSGVVLTLDALMCVAFAKLRLEHRPLAFAGIRSAGIVVNIAANVVFLTKYQLGPEGVLMASVLSSAVTLALLAPVYAQSLRFEFAGPLFREMWAFAWPFIPAGLAATAVQVIDRPILLFLTDQSTLGIYQAGYRLGIFMMLVVSMFDQAWRPFFLENHEKPGAPELFARVFTYFAVFGAAVALCVSLFIGDLARLSIFGRHFIAQNYWGGLAVVPVVLAAYLLYGFYINFMAGPMLSKQT